MRYAICDMRLQYCDPYMRLFKLRIQLFFIALDIRLFCGQTQRADIQMYKQRLCTHNAHASRIQIWLVRQGMLNVADLRDHKNF